VTARDWLMAAAVFALTFGAFLVLIWDEERGGHVHRPGCQHCDQRDGSAW